MDIQTDHLAAVGDGIDAVALHGALRGDPGIRPVQIVVVLQLGHHQLPEQGAVLFIEAQEDPAVALMPGIAGVGIVGADEDPPAGDHRGRMRLAAQFHHPLHVLFGGRIKSVRQALLGGHGIARPRLAPLGLIRGGAGQRQQAPRQPQTGRDPPTRTGCQGPAGMGSRAMGGERKQGQGIHGMGSGEGGRAERGGGFPPVQRGRSSLNTGRPKNLPGEFRG